MYTMAFLHRAIMIRTDVGGAVLNKGMENDDEVGAPDDEFTDPPDSVRPRSIPELPVGQDPPPTVYARIADTCSRLLDAVAEVERLEATQATQAAWKAEFVDRACTLALVNEEGVIAGSKDVLQRRDMALRCFISELACALRTPERTASTLVEESRVLVHRLPLTLNALRTGEISYRHAQQLVDQISTLTDEAAAELERRVLSFATTMTVAQFRQKTRIMRERLIPESAVQRCVKSVRDRRVEIIPAPERVSDCLCKGWRGALKGTDTDVYDRRQERVAA
ncbi:hypothetical protein L1277_002364, partial [Okibacterium sp. HSC-33S16]|uniref:DUF222 domain-containing protein n=1 Tax=Okibacterium sp. HSC-33S16 TaxID=2910965 RepID=UPI00209D39AD